MGYIKEPEGVDFVIDGKPLTNEQKQAISDFIKTDKIRAAGKVARPNKATNTLRTPIGNNS